MSFFEKFESSGAISANGHIRGRLDEYLDDITVNSLVREILFMEESDLYATYSEKERKEFLFRVFQHLVIGGASNQYEDEAEEYLKATKVRCVGPRRWGIGERGGRWGKGKTGFPASGDRLRRDDDETEDHLKWGRGHCLKATTVRNYSPFLPDVQRGGFPLNDVLAPPPA